MATWRPKRDEPVGNNEHVGRRLFDEPMLAGLDNQKNYQGLLLTHFQEKRDLEFSLDRLGRSGIEKQVTAYLVPRAQADSEKFRTPKAFHGWAVIRPTVLSKPQSGAPMPIVASPQAGLDLSENIYHAHILLPAAEDALSVALRLRHLFVSQGYVETVSENRRQVPAESESLLQRMLIRALAAWRWVADAMQNLRR